MAPPAISLPQNETSQLTAGLHPIDLDPAKALPQDQCPFFSVLPAEVRDIIYDFALAQYEDSTAAYTLQTYYARPDYAAPRRCDTALLRVCQRVYREAWFRPWTSAEHTLFLVGSLERRPERVTTVEDLTNSLSVLHASHPQPVEVAHVRIFPQLFKLESGEPLGQVLGMPHFHPRAMTITIRHTDWWHWENDETLYVEGEFTKRCAFPASLRALRLELETTERRAAQVDSIAEQMVRHWRFRRQDGASLVPAGPPSEPLRWRGSSILADQRWLADEVAPATLAYYVRTLTFVPSGEPASASGAPPLPAYDRECEYEEGSARLTAQGNFRADFSGQRAVKLNILDDARIPHDLDAEQTRARLRDYWEERRRAGPRWRRTPGLFFGNQVPRRD